MKLDSGSARPIIKSSNVVQDKETRRGFLHSAVAGLAGYATSLVLMKDARAQYYCTPQDCTEECGFNPEKHCRRYLGHCLAYPTMQAVYIYEVRTGHGDDETNCCTGFSSPCGQYCTTNHEPCAMGDPSLKGNRGVA